MKKSIALAVALACTHLFAGVQPVTQNPYTTNAPAALAQQYASTVTNNQIFSYFTLTATGEADFRVNSSGNFSIDDSVNNRFQVQDGGAIVLVDESGNSKVVITTNGSTFAGTFTGNGSGLSNPATNTYTMTSTGYTNSNPWDVRIFKLQGTSILFTNLTSRFGFSIGTISVNNDFVILHTNECVTGTGMTGQILR